MLKQIRKGGKIEEKDVAGSGIVKKGDHWVNENVMTITKVKCKVPAFLTNVLKAFTIKFPRDEFSIFCKFSWNEALRRIEVNTEYFVPKQRVSSAHVDYDEDSPDGFGGVIHKHPTGCSRFSGTDEEYINQNHDLSILWEDNRLREGKIRINTPYGRISLPLEFIEDEELLPTIPKEELAKITRNTTYIKTNNRRTWAGGRYNHKHSTPSRYTPAMFGYDDVDEPGGFLNDDLDKINGLIEHEKENDVNRVNAIFKIADEQNVTWDEAEKIYEASNGKKMDNIQDIKSKLQQNSPTKLPGAVKGIAPGGFNTLNSMIGCGNIKKG